MGGDDDDNDDVGEATDETEDDDDDDDMDNVGDDDNSGASLPFRSLEKRWPLLVKIFMKRGIFAVVVYYFFEISKESCSCISFEN